VDPKHGGSGSTFIASIVAIEELAKVDPSVSVVCDVQNTLINEFLKRYASKYLQNKYFPRLTTDLVRVFPSSINDGKWEGLSCGRGSVVGVRSLLGIWA